MKTIALIAYAVSNRAGSEYAVGWDFVKHMAETGLYNITVYYGSCMPGTMGISESFPLLKNVTWKCVELPNDLKNKFFWFVRCKVYYVFGFYFQFKEWHELVFKEIERDNNLKKYDVVHYLNPIGIKEPGYAWLLNIPYVWGPVQGVERWPKCLLPVLDIKGKIEALIRYVLQNHNLKHSIRLYKAMNRADAVISATPNTQLQLKAIFGKESVYLPENGLRVEDIKRSCSLKKYDKTTKLEIIWVGELSNRKGLVLLLMALNQIQESLHNVHLSVLGEGTQSHHLKEYAIKHNLTSVVSFFGKLSRDEVLKKISNSHLHVITSLSEATTTVIWEAKANGVPTMTLDHCGMSGVVTEESGIKIPVISLAQVVNDIASHIVEIIREPAIIERLSAGVIKTNSLYTWDKRCMVFHTVYQDAIESHESRF